MTFIERLNTKADELFLGDNCLRTININHKDSISLIFQSVYWNNEVELSDEEKKELNLQPHDSIILRETFYDVSIINVAYSSRNSFDSSEALKTIVTDDDTYEILWYTNPHSDFGSLKFKFKRFKWELVDVGNDFILIEKSYS